MENDLKVNETELKLHINDEIIANLKVTSFWANFLSIIGFVYTGLLILMGVGFLIALPIIGNEIFPVKVFPINYIGIIYIVIGLVYLIPTLYLNRFADKIKTALLNFQQIEFESGFKNLKSLFKFMGITTIIIITLSFLVIPIIFISGIMMVGN
jgi:hypothetical protein